jgi:sugar lactone lactonase YvrE
VRGLAAVALCISGALITGLAATTTSAGAANASPLVYEIDSGANAINVFPATASGNAAPAVHITANAGSLNAPLSAAFDAQGDLWVANSGGSIVEFTPSQLETSGSPVPPVVINVSGSPTAVAFDGARNLWVTTETDGVQEFMAGQITSSGTPTPAATISSGSGWGLTFDTAGDLWVTTYAVGNSIVEYTPAEQNSSGTPSETFSGYDNPNSPTFDASGDLWFSAPGTGPTGSVAELTAAQLAAGPSPDPAVKLTGAAVGSPAGLAFDSAGDLWAADQGTDGIYEYTPSQLGSSNTQSPTVTIGGSSGNSNTTFDTPTDVLVAYQTTPTAPSITNLPSNPIYSSGGGFTATVSTDSNGTQSVTSSTPGVCTASGLVVTYVSAGQCTLTAQVAESLFYTAASGTTAQSFTVGAIPPTAPSITNLPSNPTYSSGGGFTATVSTDSNGTQSVTSSTPGVCTASGLVVTYVAAGQCTLTAQVTASATYAAASGTAQSFTVGSAAPSTPTPTPTPTPTHGYWLVGSDGGIFSFGQAQFYGSTGSLHLQRPVVGTVPTSDHGGYWLDASDGGVFSYGDTQFYGSIPGLGLHPAGSGLPNSLNAPIVGMVPSADGGGYFMVASDGGVFAFGDAHFAGSCPGIGGCSGAAVAVMPDASGNGYWLVTQTGSVYTFGDASYYGAPGNTGSPVTSAVRTPNGGGYWILTANGTVHDYGDASNYGDATGSFGGSNPATAIFTTSDGGGYWIASANGTVNQYGDAPNDGDISGTHLNGSIIAGTGF